jgi:Ca-activated chloride channel family protein
MPSPKIVEKSAARSAACPNHLQILFAALLLALLAAVMQLAQAAPSGEPPATYRPRDSGSGHLFLRPDSMSAYIPAPLVHTNVKIAVSGLVGRAVVTQRFHNPSDLWVEGIYVFPLPEGSAVDRLRLSIGERRIEGRILERQQATRAYQQARDNGQRAGLVEQERPNIFTTSVANIGPNETVVVEIEFQESLRYDHGKFALRLPLVVGPRYIPGEPLIASARGWAPPTTQVADADRITPPVLHPALGAINPVTLAVSLDAGMKIAAVTSATHDIVVTPADGTSVHVTLAVSSIPADRDFELVWVPEVGVAPRAGLFAEERDGQRHLLLMVMPPATTTALRMLPRETIFIIDTSGSMEGQSITQAKAALTLALDQLKPTDRFNVIQFNSTASALFGAAQPAQPEALRKAHVFVDHLRATGGTEMLPALSLALDGRSDSQRLRQIVFLTDGLVGNEPQLFRYIVDKLGDSRLFTIGIGSAPNQWFMARSARAGRGTYTNISRIDQVGDRMAALFNKLERPVLTDLAVDWPDGVTVESYPDPLPDLYVGEPIVLSARIASGALPTDAAVTIRGRVGDQPWRATLALDRAADNAGVAALWARRKIERLSETVQEGANANEARTQSLEVALNYGLVSRHTSLVAVEQAVARPADRGLNSARLPLNLPNGMSHEAVFGGPNAPAGQRHGALPTQLAATPASVAQTDVTAPVPLPQTATAAELHRLVGVVLMLLALALLGAARWRRRA